MRRLILGGSFNPIHHGHLVVARTVAEQLGFSTITLMPTGHSPHKPLSASMAPAEDRLAMARLATANDDRFEVSDLETTRIGPSYTIDTIRDLAARGERQIHWIIGADMLLYLPQWHKATELVNEVNFVIIARPGWQIDWQTLPQQFRHLQDNVISAPLIDITASDIRRRIAAGKSIRYLTPDAVCEYIQTHSLYCGT